MEELFGNPGLYLIVKHISSYLDVKSLAQCRQVSQAWRDLIDNDRPWLIFQLKHLQNQMKADLRGNIVDNFPEWKATLEHCSRSKNISKLKSLIKHMWKHYKDDELRLFSLQHAASKSNIGLVQLFVDFGIDLNMKDPNGWTPLHYACIDGNFEMVQLLIKHTPTFDATSKTNDKLGWTIFHFAVRNPDPQVPKLILDTYKFEDVIARTTQGSTMFHSAVSKGPIDTILYLIENRQKLGINIEDGPNAGWTILHIACKFSSIQVIDIVIKELEDIGSSIDLGTPNEKQITPLHFACAHNTSDVVIHLLQRFPEKINLLGKWGMHVVHYACQYGRLVLLKYLLGNPDFDIDINVKDNRGSTPLHLACYKGQFDVVKFIFETFVDIIDFNVTDLLGCTPLHIACYSGRLQIVKFILENAKLYGIDVDKKNNNGYNAEDIAKARERKEIVKLFVKSVN